MGLSDVVIHAGKVSALTPKLEQNWRKNKINQKNTHKSTPSHDCTPKMKQNWKSDQTIISNTNQHSRTIRIVEKKEATSARHAAAKFSWEKLGGSSVHLPLCWRQQTEESWRWSRGCVAGLVTALSPHRCWQCQKHRGRRWRNWCSGSTAGCQRSARGI